MSATDKIDLLRVLLDANEDYNTLLNELHRLAIVLHAEGGLPLGGLPLYDDKNCALFVMAIKEWLCKLVLEKA